MNTEDLLIIVDAVRGLGESGLTAFIWWLVAEKGVSLLTTILILGFFSYLGHVVARTIRQVCEAGRHIRDLYFMATGTEIVGEIQPYHLKDIHAVLRRGKG